MSRLGRGRGRIGASRVRSEYFALEGGLNQTTPALSLKAGECIASVNHEPAVPRGYSRVGGIERYDGQPSPTASQYWILEFNTGSVEIPLGSEITSKTVPGPVASLITARTISLPIVLSGSFGAGDAVGYVVLMDVEYADGGDDEFTIGDVLTYSTDISWAVVDKAEQESGVVVDIVTGTTVPLDGLYLTLLFDAGTNEPAIGDLILGQSSGTEGELISMPVVTSGSWAGNDAVGFLILVNFEDKRFIDDEALVINGTTAVACADAVETGEVYVATSDGIYFYYKQLAQEDRRAVIDPVPGIGPVRGVWMYNGDVYAFRDEDEDYAKMFKESTAGWVEQTLGYQLGFVNGINASVEPSIAVEVIGTTSGAVGTLKRVATDFGNWSVGDPSVGELVFTSIVGTFQCGEDLVSGGSVIAQAAAAQTANALAAGGHYEFHNYNFYASANYYRMYFVNGVNKACEWDGETLVLITTGTEEDKPTHLRAFAYHLFLTFRGGSLQNSGPGKPVTFSALEGASEMGVGDEISELIVEPGNTMSVLSRNSVHILHGSSVADFILKPYHQNMGAIEWSAQKIGQSWFLDDRGLTTLTQTEQYGDFKQNSVSAKVEPFLRVRMGSVRCSQIARGKNQYRIFFDDGFALFGAFDGNKVLGFLPIQYNVTPFCSESVEDENGLEHLFIGCDNGYVYEQDIGTSYDGEAITASFTLNYYHYKTPTYNKTFRGVTFELDVVDNTDIKFQPDFSYGNEEMPRATEQQNYVVGGGGLWDYALWDKFLWSGQVVSTGRNRIDGKGANMGLTLFSSSKYLEPYTIQGATVDYSVRRLIR